MELILASYNSTGLGGTRIDFIRDFLVTNCVDVMLLQETWLLSSQLSKLSSIHNNYLFHGICGMPDSSDFVAGRPYGGLAILWHRSLASQVKMVPTKNKRTCAVVITLNQQKVLLVNVYLPCDNYSQSLVNPEYQDVLDDILCLWLECDAKSLIVGGDFNTDPRRHNVQSSALANFLTAVDGALAHNCHDAQQPSDTYFSYDGRNSSCVDHFVIQNSLKAHVSRYQTVDHVLNLSNHVPIIMHVDVNVLKEMHEPTRLTNDGSIAWGRITNEHIAEYRNHVNIALSSLEIPRCIRECHAACSNAQHKFCIDVYCEQLCDICVRAARSSFPRCRPNKMCMPKWKDEMKPFKDSAIFWDAIWKACGRPRDGKVFEIRRRTKNEYRYAFRRYRLKEKVLRKERMGEEILRNNHRQFWQEVNFTS